ncbi:RIP metalloprotease RseP [Terrihabitans rhizophilus]|jgi:regulator of sigma E protease|uniref:Zinc metalloprotease n=1 Tax=Terrihabitans rhizophilus TaxID=3092662 RepID=A0ABU4RML7_9HYPH|nr:RIP metalloprotease RseP [Terrihabitans sp. PJ23]MDX6805468.1 RIP metalloprotease RseP [Terrihabitans sp. PJ23]
MMSAYDIAAGAVTYVVPYVAVLAIVIFIHEMGHFLVARWCGIRVLTFSMGFGPEIAHFHDRKGTRWRLAAIPLGGYVKFYGDENAASAPDRERLAAMPEQERSVSFYGQSVGKRAAVVAAGPVANFLLAIVIFTASFWIYGRPASEARVDQVVAGSAAEAAGFQPDDVILRIDGSSIGSFADMQRIVRISPERAMRFDVRRGEQEVSLTASPKRQEVQDSFGQTLRIGVLGISRKPETEIPHRDYSLGEAVAGAVGETWFVVDRTMSYIGGIFTGRESADQLSGPIRIAQVSGQAAQLGFEVLFELTAVISISIGLLNLFPIPLLDGGHLLFYAVEAIRGRPLSERAQEVGFRIGIAMVLSLMLFATWNDIVHLAT